MNLIQLAKQLPDGGAVEFHGLHDVEVVPLTGAVTLTVGSWVRREDALNRVPPQGQSKIVIHFGDWQPEYFGSLFDLVAGMAEWSGGQVVSALPPMTETPVVETPASEPVVFDVGAAP